jgi:hypothetical protein
VALNFRRGEGAPKGECRGHRAAPANPLVSVALNSGDGDRGDFLCACRFESAYFSRLATMLIIIPMITAPKR